MPGIIAIPDDLPIGQAIEQLHIYASLYQRHQPGSLNLLNSSTDCSIVRVQCALECRHEVIHP